MTMIPFNKPFLTGKEAHYMYEAVFTGKLSGNGAFTKKCQGYFEKRFMASRSVCSLHQAPMPWRCVPCSAS